MTTKLINDPYFFFKVEGIPHIILAVDGLSIYMINPKNADAQSGEWFIITNGNERRFKAKDKISFLNVLMIEHGMELYFVYDERNSRDYIPAIESAINSQFIPINNVPTT